LLGLVYWLGFPQAEVPYVKEARLHGRSGWTFRKLVNLFANTFFSFSTMPLRGMTMVGLLLACLGVLVVAAGLLSGPRATQLGLPLLGLVLGSLAVACGVNLVALGVLGEYIWRVADEVRGRPRYLVARTVNLNSEAGASSPDQTSRGVR
jgi:dolichol-phosphate mannosyltransferase